MPHICTVSADNVFLVGDELGAKYLSRLSYPSHRGQPSGETGLHLKSLLGTHLLKKYSARKDPPHSPFHANNLKERDANELLVGKGNYYKPRNKSMGLFVRQGSWVLVENEGAKQ